MAALHRSEEEAWRIKLALMKREQQIAKDMAKLYQPTERRMKEAIARFAQQAALAEIDTAEGKLWAKQRMEVLLAQLQEEAQLVARQAGKRTQAAQMASAQAAITDGKTLAKALSIGQTWASLPKEALREFTGRSMDGTPLGKLFADLGQDVSMNVREIIFAGLAQGQGPKVMAREMDKAVEGLTRERAILIARTESIRAYRESSIKGFQQNSPLLMGWRWTASKTGRTCPVCLALDGSIHSNTEEFGSHPACRCTPVPVPITGDIQRETGKEWFDKQLPRVQQSILGPQKYQLFKDGKITLDDLVDRHNTEWGPTANVKTIKQLVAEGKVSAEDSRQARRLIRWNMPTREVTAQQPTGIPVSNALQLPSVLAKNRKAIKLGVDLIDSVHGDGDLPKAKIISEALSNAYGSYSPASNKIKINNVGVHDHPVMTTAHEIGHFLDRRALPGDGFASDLNESVLAGWKDAVYNSEKFKKLQEYGDEYLLSRPELFARSYAQFIATKTEDSVMLREIEWMRRYEPKKVWDNEDFKSIFQAFEELCRKLKWSA